MENRHRLIIIRFIALVALAVCAALLMVYFRPETLLCGPGFDCDAVTSSPFSKVAGVPLPVIGMLAFAAMLACSLSSQPRWLRLMRFLALAGSVIGLTLIYLQAFVLHQMCPFCLVVDCCAIGAAYAALRWRADPVPMPRRRVRYLWLGAAVAALGLGVAFGAARNRPPEEEPTTAPPEISAHWVPGKVNLVEIMDFNCPHCQQLHPMIKRVLREHSATVHYVRIVSPLATHPESRAAARAYHCAQAQGKGEALADALFESTDLSPINCERLAVELGVSKKEYLTCVSSAETDKIIDATVAWVKTAAPHGVPCVWVQDRRLAGVPTFYTLRKAVEEAEQSLPASAR